MYFCLADVWEELSKNEPGQTFYVSSIVYFRLNYLCLVTLVMV